MVLRYDGEANAVINSTQAWAFAVDGDASNVVVTKLKFNVGGVVLSDGKLYQNIRIVWNEFVNVISSGPGNDRVGVQCTIDNKGLIVDNNYFHDFAGWGGYLWWMDYGSFSNNTFYNLVQGAHILEPGINITVSDNWGTSLQRMGLEIQGNGNLKRPPINLFVERNVFYNWIRPYYDSFGLSIVPNYPQNLRIVGNILKGNFTGDWGNTGTQGKRMGYGIEISMQSGLIQDNIVGGEFWYYMSVASKNTQIYDSHMYGVPNSPPESGPGGYIGDEPGSCLWV